MSTFLLNCAHLNYTSQDFAVKSTEINIFRARDPEPAEGSSTKKG